MLLKLTDSVCARKFIEPGNLATGRESDAYLTEVEGWIMNHLRYALLLCWSMTAPLAMAASVDIGLSVDSGGLSGWSLGVRDYYQVEEPEYRWVEDSRLDRSEWPVVFEIARQAQVSPEVVLELRQQGWSWMDISWHLGVYAERYYVPVSFAERRGLYWDTYRYYRQWPRDRWHQIRFSDNEFIALINLRFMSGHYHYRPEQIVRWRHSGRDWGWMYRQPRAQTSYRPDWGWHHAGGHSHRAGWQSDSDRRDWTGHSRWQSSYPATSGRPAQSWNTTSRPGSNWNSNADSHSDRWNSRPNRQDLDQDRWNSRPNWQGQNQDRWNSRPNGQGQDRGESRPSWPNRGDSTTETRPRPEPSLPSASRPSSFRDGDRAVWQSRINAGQNDRGSEPNRTDRPERPNRNGDRNPNRDSETRTDAGWPDRVQLPRTESRVLRVGVDRPVEVPRTETRRPSSFRDGDAASWQRGGNAQESRRSESPSGATGSRSRDNAQPIHRLRQ